MKNQMNWRKFWKDFGIWVNAQDPAFGGIDFPEWNKQAREIGKRLVIYFPSLNRRKLWRDFDRKYKNCNAAVPEWSVQKQWIRVLVQKQDSLIRR